MKMILLLLFILWSLVSCGPPLAPEGPSPYGYYSRADVEYFFEIGLCFELSECQNPHVTRWTSEVLIQIHGQYSSYEEKELDSIIGELSELTGLSITKTNQSANINIYFIPRKQFQQHCVTYEPNQPQEGYFELNLSGNTIYKASICIINNLEITQKLHLLREELTQSLGIGSDSNRYADSIFQQSPHYQPTKYSEIDKKVIRLLYDARVTPGMTQSEVDQALRSPPATTQAASSVIGSFSEGG